MLLHEYVEASRPPRSKRCTAGISRDLLIEADGKQSTSWRQVDGTLFTGMLLAVFNLFADKAEADLLKLVLLIMFRLLSQLEVDDTNDSDCPGRSGIAKRSSRKAEMASMRAELRAAVAQNAIINR